MFAARRQRHQVDDIDGADFQFREMLVQQVDGGQHFQGRYIAGAGHHDVRFLTLVVACPCPDADAHRAMLDRGVHVQPLRSWLLAGDDDVVVVAAAQTMVGDREECVGVGMRASTVGPAIL